MNVDAKTLKLVQPLWKTIRRFLKKLKIELPYYPAIPLLGIFPKKIKTLIRKYICTPMFTLVLFTIAKIWKQFKCPSVDERIKKMQYINTMEYYSAKKEWNHALAKTWMDLEGIMLSKIDQTEKDRHHMISFICGKEKNKWKNITKQEQSYR